MIRKYKQANPSVRNFKIVHILRNGYQDFDVGFGETSEVTELSKGLLEYYFRNKKNAEYERFKIEVEKHDDSILTEIERTLKEDPTNVPPTKAEQHEGQHRPIQTEET